MSVMQQPEAHYHMAPSRGPRSQMVRAFLVFTFIWQEDFAKFLKYQRPNAMLIWPGQ